MYTNDGVKIWFRNLVLTRASSNPQSADSRSSPSPIVSEQSFSASMTSVSTVPSDFRHSASSAPAIWIDLRDDRLDLQPLDGLPLERPGVLAGAIFAIEWFLQEREALAVRSAFCGSGRRQSIRRNPSLPSFTEPGLLTHRGSPATGR
jgi:hypothetical protein